MISLHTFRIHSLDVFIFWNSEFFIFRNGSSKDNIIRPLNKDPRYSATADWVLTYLVFYNIKYLWCWTNIRGHLLWWWWQKFNTTFLKFHSTCTCMWPNSYRIANLCLEGLIVRELLLNIQCCKLSLLWVKADHILFWSQLTTSKITFSPLYTEGC